MQPIAAGWGFEAGSKATRGGDALNPFDKHFRTDEIDADLRGRSVRAAGATMAAQAGRFVLTLGSTMVLARILTPRDFGLLTMVTAVNGTSTACSSGDSETPAFSARTRRQRAGSSRRFSSSRSP